MIIFLFLNFIFSLSPRHFLKEDFLGLPLQKKQKQSEESDLDFIVDEKIMESEEDLMEGINPFVLESDFFEFQVLDNKTHVTPRWDVILEQFHKYPQGVFADLFRQYMMSDKFEINFKFPYIDPENRAQKSDVSLQTYFNYMPKFKEKLENSSHWLSLSPQGLRAVFEASFFYPSLQIILISDCISSTLQQFVQKEFPQVLIVGISCISDWPEFLYTQKCHHKAFLYIDVVSDFFGLSYYNTDYNLDNNLIEWSTLAVNTPISLFTYPCYRKKDQMIMPYVGSFNNYSVYHEGILKTNGYISQFCLELRDLSLSKVLLTDAYLYITFSPCTQNCLRVIENKQVLMWDVVLQNWRFFPDGFIVNLFQKLLDDPVSFQKRGIKIGPSCGDIGLKTKVSFTNRSLQDYFNFMPLFEQQLSCATHWLDLGAGMLLAMMQAYFMYPSLQMTAVSVDVDDKFKEFVEAHFPRIRVLNEWFSNISLEELSPSLDIDVISDVYGVIYYSSPFDFSSLSCLNGNNPVSLFVYPASASGGYSHSLCLKSNRQGDLSFDSFPSYVTDYQVLSNNGCSLFDSFVFIQLQNTDELPSLHFQVDLKKSRLLPHIFA